VKATGTFDVTLTPQASDLSPEGPNLGRMSLDKQYHGDLNAAAKGEMITAAGLAVKESAAYSAVERVSGTLHGRKGGFAALVRVRVRDTEELSPRPTVGPGASGLSFDKLRICSSRLSPSTTPRRLPPCASRPPIA